MYFFLPMFKLIDVDKRGPWSEADILYLPRKLQQLQNCLDTRRTYLSLTNYVKNISIVKCKKDVTPVH